MAELDNLRRMTSATTGTGTLTLGTAVSGCLAFPSSLDGKTVTYGIDDGAASETGRGVYTHGTLSLTRAIILTSTNGGSAINCSGTQEVFIMAAAEDIRGAQLFGDDFVTPILTDFTAQNSASASVNRSGSIYLSAAASASDNWRWYNKNVPSSPYTITLCVTPHLVSAQYLFSGFVWDDGTKLVTFGYDTGTLIGEHSLTCRDWTNVTTHSADNKLQPFVNSGPIWLRAGEDASNRIMSFSKDGYNFIDFLTETKTNHLTATKVGWGVNSRTASWPSPMTIHSWKET